MITPPTLVIRKKANIFTYCLQAVLNTETNSGEKKNISAVENQIFNLQFS